jgi:hypothetical protein
VLKLYPKDKDAEKKAQECEKQVIDNLVIGVTDVGGLEL